MTLGFEINGTIANGPRIAPCDVSTLPRGRYPIVTIPDPRTALATFMGILASGRTAGISSKATCGSLSPDLFFEVPAPLETLNTKSAFSEQFITFTGGTTSDPKIILRSPESWKYSFERLGVTSNDKVACFSDMSHSIALYAGVEAVHQGAEYYALSDVPLREWSNSISDLALTCLYMTPTQLRVIGSFSPPAATKIRSVFLGGGSVDSELLATANKLFPNASIQVFYGSAETSFVTLADETTPKDSSGPAFEGVHIKIGEFGHVYVKSPMMFDGYAVPPKTPAQTSGDYVSVGELGHLAGGNLFLLGRSDRVVTISDQSVSLDAIEASLLDLSNVLHAAVVTHKDTFRGLGLSAVVMTLDGSHDLGVHQLAHSDAQTHRLQPIRRVSKWPMTVGGKTDYAAIQTILDTTE
jgi:long-chain acyl-CoA synthetase